jgi:hypothetical protein
MLVLSDKTRFPSGMNHLTDQIHSLGMKAGIVRRFEVRNEKPTHSSTVQRLRLVHLPALSGFLPERSQVCGKLQIIFTHLLIEPLRDVRMFQEWGFDYLKYIYSFFSSTSCSDLVVLQV